MAVQELAWCTRIVPVVEHAERVVLLCMCACMAAFGNLHTASGLCSPAVCASAGWQPHHNRAAPPLALQQVLQALHVSRTQHHTALLQAHLCNTTLTLTSRMSQADSGECIKASRVCCYGFRGQSCQYALPMQQCK